MCIRDSAWNTVIRNYQVVGGKNVAMFGESAAKPVDFVSLIANDYIKSEIAITPAANSPFNVKLIQVDENGDEVSTGGQWVLRFTQKTGTLNPGSSSSFVLKATDCFGIAKEWTLSFSIQQ